MREKYVIEYWDKDQNTIESRVNSDPKTVKIFGCGWMWKVKRLESKGCEVLAVYIISGYTRVPVY